MKGAALGLASCLAAAWLAAGVAAAQEAHTVGTTTGGRASASSARLAAQDLARSLGLSCEATAAVALGRGENGAPHYEVACADGSGYRLVGGSAAEAFDCLALASRSGPDSPACRLPANRDGTARVARFAREAGLDCRVDAGAMIGLTGAGRPLYEAGCAGTTGAWLEQAETGWVATDCLAVSARGQACRFTTEAEALAAFQARLADGPARDCRPTDIRYMGEGASGPLYEARCRAGGDLVLRFGRDHRLSEVIPCEAAAHIGGSCTLGEPPRR